MLVEVIRQGGGVGPAPDRCCYGSVEERFVRCDSGFDAEVAFSRQRPDSGPLDALKDVNLPLGERPDGPFVVA